MNAVDTEGTMPAQRTAGVERRRSASPLLGTAWMRPERIARLRGAFERVAARCVDNLADLAPSPVGLAVRTLSAGKIGEVLAPPDASGAVGVFRNAGPGAPVLIAADGAGLEALVEAMLGADGSEPANGRSRPLSRIERRLAGTLFEQVVKALQGAYAGSGPAPYVLDAVEDLAKKSPLVRRDDDWLRVIFDLSTLDRAGELYVLLPPPAIQRLQPHPPDMASPGPVVHDPRWSERMQQELTRTHVTLHAVLDEREFTLGEIAELKPGQTLHLRATPQSRTRVLCKEQTLFWCALGQADGVYTLRVQDFADEEQELIDAILSD